MRIDLTLIDDSTVFQEHHDVEEDEHLRGGLVNGAQYRCVALLRDVAEQRDTTLRSE